MLPTTVKDFVVTKLAGLPAAARLAVIFDPYADLDLDEILEVEPDDASAETRRWRVLRYDGNDLAFRQQYGQRSGQSDLIWVTASPGLKRGASVRIELHSLVDLWSRAEAFIDASLPGVLHQLVPGEIWPEAPIYAYADILGQNLPAVINGWQELRRHLGGRGSITLDVHIIRTLALHCVQPTIPIERLLFRVDTPTRVLATYLDLLWCTDWSVPDLTLLQEQAREAPPLDLPGDVAAWFNIPPPTLALYFYLRHFLGRFHISDIAIKLRGLGLFDLDVTILEAQVGSILDRWERDPVWRSQIIRQAEAVLTLSEVNRVIELLALNTPADVAEALAGADTPATIYLFQIKFFELAFETKAAYQYTPGWREHRPAHLGNLPESPFKETALTLSALLDEIAFIDARLPLSIPVQADMARLVDWYIEHELYDLEYAHARAGGQLLKLSDKSFDNQLRQKFALYLKWQKERLAEFLDTLDQSLARLITTDWGGYLSHPRLSINVLNDMVKRRRLKFTTQARLWVVIFDGMRWDTWARHIKPRLLETFELVEPEKTYLSLLPSWTGVARTGLLAGKLPGDWKSYQQKFTRDQAQLSARLFNIPQSEQNRQLQFFSNMESDRKYSQAHGEKQYPYNILVFNISDDNLHSQQGNLLELNKVVNTLLDNILESLKNLVEPADTLIIASDHGFVELEEGRGVVIADDRRWERYQAGEAHPVRYRYISSHDIPVNQVDVYRVEYRGLFDKYTVAIGRRWFKRADSRGREDRYAHGGLSLAEMVVPGVILKRITAKQMKPALSVQPTKLELAENETKRLTIAVTNQGNVPLAGQLTVWVNTVAEPVTYDLGVLLPTQSHQVTCEVTGVYQTRSDKTIYMTEKVRVTFNYTDLAGQPKKTTKNVPVTVTPRTDVVQLDFGGLPDLDI